MKYMPSPLRYGNTENEMPERISNVFIRIMLGIYMLLLGLGVFLGTFGKLESPSYILALVLAGGLFLCLWLLRPRLGRAMEMLQLPGAFVTGLVLSLFCLLLNLGLHDMSPYPTFCLLRPSDLTVYLGR